MKDIVSKAKDKVKELFAIKKTDVEVPAPETNNGEPRKEGETYKQYGLRIAGIAQGSEYSLSPHLQSVYLSLKKEQSKDKALQDELRKKQLTAIANTETEKEQAENNLQATQTKIEDIVTKVDEKKKEIEKLKSAAYTSNKAARTQLYISGILLIPFTIYFFIFYSSVAYSAFFDSFDAATLGDSWTNATIFNSKALVNAWHDGFFEMMFVLLMPIIFLAFGFILNRWELEKGKLKFVKIPGIILVAFIFDTLLAYEICEKIYSLGRDMSLAEMPPYGMGMAFKDPRFWVIICLGFVAYLIWGITFGYFIKALNDLDLNRIKQETLESDVSQLEEEKSATQEKEITLKNEIANLVAKIHKHKLSLDDFTRYDIGKIKLELANFYSGWQQYLAVMGKSETDKNKAETIYDEFMKKLSQTTAETDN